MYLEQALSENNDFIRLQKIGLGCKAITARVPFLTNFDDPNILRLLLYCYPYSTSSIEMILQCMMDKFQTVEFCDAMFTSLIQIGSTKEITRTSLKTQRHSTLKMFTNSVYSNIPQIKLYSLSILKPMFYLAQRLNLPMEQRTLLFIRYLQNTTNEELISRVLGIFAQLKQQQMFGHTWIMNVEDQIYQCLNGSPQVTQSSVDSFEVMQKSDHNSLDIEEWIITGDTNVETIIGQFSSPARFNQFMAYIFNPQYYPIADNWYPQVRIPFDSQYYMKYGQRLDKYEILRSTKVLQIIMNYDNFNQLYNAVPHIYSQIFTLLQNSFQDTGDINYLHHTASLLDFLISQMPKTSLYFILQLNLLFYIPKLLHNNTIYNILAKLLDIIHDQYNVGNKCNQLLWRYIYHSKWFEFVIQQLQNKDMTQQLSMYVEGQQIACILAELKQLIAYEKPKLDQTAQHTNQITQESLLNELNNQDIDNLASLTNQFKKSRTTIRQQPPINLIQKIDNSSVKRKSLTQKCVPQIDTIFKLMNNDKQLKGSLTPNYQIKLDQMTFHVPSISRTSRITTKVSEQHDSTARDGILNNIGRLYPNYRNSICSSQFEKNQQQYQCNVVLAERFSQLVLLQLQIFIMNKNGSYKQSRNVINTADFWNSMSNQKTFEYYFQTYLFQLLNEERYEIAIQFGSIVNLIVENRHITQKYQQINAVCANSMDYLCKQIVKCNIVATQLHAYINPNELKQQTQTSTIILYLLNTMLLILQMQSDQQMDSMKNIYLHLNETVLHVLMNQFFSSVHNNIFQQKFIKLLTLIFANAPYQVLLAILFKLGLVPKVYDAMKLLIDNNMLKLRHLDSFYFHLTLIPYIIKQAFDSRNMGILETQLNTLQSWNHIKTLASNVEYSNIHHTISAEFSIEQEIIPNVKPHFQSACNSPVNDVKLSRLLIPTRFKALRKYTNH